ncbi:MAG: adenylyl cyclase, partial [Gaiellaceae bacterium]
LAYGDGVAFWALAEVVKAQAGILERDSEAEAAEKLRVAVADAIDDAGDARWVESHLRPLVGLESETVLGGDRRGEAFAAWRRYLEALAEQRPLVLEDLPWADEGLLDFVDELVDWLSGVALLVVCSARPELLERRPGWGGGKLNAATLGLSPLSQEQTAVLISHVLERALLPAEIQQALLERAEGNPLYAEQFAALYLERGSAEDMPLPETLQGILAARLDGLSAGAKPSSRMPP